MYCMIISIIQRLSIGTSADARRGTHDFEVFRSALQAPEVAGEQHVADVVARTVVELPHVEGPRLEVVEVRFELQGLQNILLHQV